MPVAPGLRVGCAFIAESCAGAFLIRPLAALCILVLFGTKTFGRRAGDCVVPERRPRFTAETLPDAYPP